MSDVTAVPLRPVGRSGVTALWIGVGLMLAAGIGGAYATTAAPVAAFAPAPEFLAWNGKRHGVRTTPSGLQYQVLKPGEGAKGAKPTAADVVQVDYVGKLTNGTQFDANPAGQPVAMPVGQVVPGFAEALQLMPRGSKYRVWLPPQLAYGDRETGPIPANSVLVFDITMHDFRPMPPQGAVPSMPGM